MSEQLYILTLGSATVRKGGESLSFRTRKALGILMYLCVEELFQPGVEHPRSKLAEMFWPGITLKSALENLRQAVYQIKQATPLTAEEEVLVLTNRQYIQINPRASYFLDVAQLLTADSSPESHTFEFQGEFLEHFFLPQVPEFEAWVTQKRIQIKDRIRLALQDRISQAGDLQHWGRGLELARHAVNWSPESEHAHRALAYFLAKTGDHVEAISTLREYEQRIADTYDTGLSPNSLQLMEELQAGQVHAKVPKPLPNKKNLPWIFGIAAVLLVGWGSIMMLGPGRSTSDKNLPQHIPTSAQLLAVLPFENMYFDDQHDFLDEALTDELITALTRYGDWQVVSRTSVMRYQSTDKSLGEIAQELNVTHIIEGSVSKSQGRIRLNVKLIDAIRDVQIWANSYERQIRDMLALQAELSNEIAFRVSNIQSNKSDASFKPIDPRAYEYYLKGRIQYFKATPESVDSALYYFEKSLEVEPAYEDAHLQAANVLTTLCSWWGEGLKHIDEEWDKIYHHLSMIEGNPLYQGEVYKVRGWANMWKLDLPYAIDQLEKAVAFNPEIEFSLSGLALAYVYAGRFEDALKVTKESQALNPATAHNYIAEGEAYCLMGSYEKALSAFHTALQYDPKYKVAATRKAWTHLIHNNFQPALHLLDSLYQENSPVYFVDGFYTAALILNQKTSRANTHIQKMIALTEQGEMGYSYYIAMAYGLLGEEEKALYWLEEMFKRKDPDGNWVYSDPLMDPLRDIPAFQELISTYLPKL